MLTISPERRILILLAGMIGGIALVLAGYGGRDLRLAGVLAAALVWLGSVIRMRRAGLRLDQSGPIAVITQMLSAGVMIGGLAAWGQMAPIEEAASRAESRAESQARLQDGLTTIISGEIIKIDGRSEGRLRFWIRLTTQWEQGAGAAPGGRSQNERQQNERAGEIVRVSFDAEKAGDVFWRLVHEAISARQNDQRAGDRTNSEPYPRAGFAPGDVVQARVRLYPPPGPLLPGAPDFAMQARAKNVVASGYVVRFLAVQPGPEGARWLTRFRHRGADRLVAQMTPPAGGIAAALLVGDRRHISGEVYEMFQRSGLGRRRGPA
jgi:predicted membrane metal-binding protein